MKYILAALALVAAAAALWLRPPQHGAGQPLPLAQDSSTGFGEVQTDRRGRLRTPAPPGIVVYVAGEVARPGVYTLGAGARAQAALERAGGPKPDADLVAVNLAEPLQDGMEVAVPKIGAAAERRGRATRPRGRRARGHGHGRRHHEPPAADAPSIDLNSAGPSDLQTLPGIGPGLASRIVQYRVMNGPFASIDELADVSGVTPRLQAALAPYIVVR